MTSWVGWFINNKRGQEITLNPTLKQCSNRKISLYFWPTKIQWDERKDVLSISPMKKKTPFFQCMKSKIKYCIHSGGE